MDSVARGRFLYDFAVYAGPGRIVVLLEAKRRSGTDVSWARAWHATLVERTAQPAAASVVLVALDRIYAWRPGADALADPDWTLDAGRVLAPYFVRLKIEPAEVDAKVFEAIVELWLQDVVRGELPTDADIGNAHGLLDALNGGEVVAQVAA